VPVVCLCVYVLCKYMCPQCVCECMCCVSVCARSVSVCVVLCMCPQCVCVCMCCVSVCARSVSVYVLWKCMCPQCVCVSVCPVFKNLSALKSLDHKLPTHALHTGSQEMILHSMRLTACNVCNMTKSSHVLPCCPLLLAGGGTVCSPRYPTRPPPS
jgi:hypothetical protein